MRIHRLEREQFLSHPVEEVFAFFAEAHNLERITPPQLRFRVLTPGPIELRTGSLIEYRLRLHGLPLDWLTRIEEWDPYAGFVDSQLVGPYRLWHHTHSFEAREGGTLMRDLVRYSLPAWPIGELGRVLVRRELAGIFDFRSGAVDRLLAS